VLELCITVWIVAALQGLAINHCNKSSNLGMLLLAIRCPIAHSAAASFAWLFDTHRNGRIGSPIVAGSSNWRRSSSSVVSFDVKAGRPPPNLAHKRTGVVQILQPAAYRTARETRCPRRRRDPAVSGGPRFGRPEQTTGTLVQIAANRSVPFANR
jgi:hypothetical protein